MEPNALLNAEIARRDAQPPFVSSLSQEELVVRNLELEKRVTLLVRLCNVAITIVGSHSPSRAAELHLGLKKVLS